MVDWALTAIVFPSFTVSVGFVRYSKDGTGSPALELISECECRIFF